MAREYKPSLPFNVAAFLLVPKNETIKGVKKKVFVPENKPFFCSFKTFGGTEKVVNDILVVENTGVIETYYDPKITSACNIRINELDYEILGTPENINQSNKYLVFKVRAIKGGA